MIVYNMRYRGAMEYDKFILNYLQYHNEVYNLINVELKNSQEIYTLKEALDKVTAVYDKYIGTERTPSYSEKLYDKITLL